MKRIKLQDRLEEEIGECLLIAIKEDISPTKFVTFASLCIKDFIQNNYRRRKKSVKHAWYVDPITTERK